MYKSLSGDLYMGIGCLSSGWGHKTLELLLYKKGGSVGPIVLLIIKHKLAMERFDKPLIIVQNSVLKPIEGVIPVLH